MGPRRQTMSGKRFMWLIAYLTMLIGGAAYSYRFTVKSVVVEFDGVEYDCGRVDDGLSSGSLVCAGAGDDLSGLRALAGSAALLGAIGLFRLWRTRFVHDHEIVGDRVTLRPATANDRRAVRETISEAIVDANGWTHAETNGILDALGVGTIGQIYLIEPNVSAPGANKVVGCMIATPGPDGAWWIGGWIGEAWQRSGFGTDAAHLVTERLFADGIRNVHVECAVDNGPVRSLLEKIGFENMGEIRTRLPNDRLERAVRYAKHTTVPSGYLGYRSTPDETMS